MLLNIGFGVTILAALALLVIAFAASWYDANLAPAGSVNGQTITKDAYNRQLAINAFRIDYAQHAGSMMIRWLELTASSPR